MKKVINCFKNPKSHEVTQRDAKAVRVFFMTDLPGGDFLRRTLTKMINAMFQKSDMGLQFPKPNKKN